jgi:hypothetical protein
MVLSPSSGEKPEGRISYGGTFIKIALLEPLNRKSHRSLEMLRTNHQACGVKI